MPILSYKGNWSNFAKKQLFLIFSILLFPPCLNSPDIFADSKYRTKDSYLAARKDLIDSGNKLRFDSQIKLSPAEEKANQYLLKLREKELARTKDYFPPAHCFPLIKKYIDSSPLLPIFRKMPKGAILHLHPSAMGDFHWLISYATYLPNCYIYTGEDTETLINGAFRFSSTPPGPGWKLVSELRGKAVDKNNFDDRLYQSITLGTEDIDRQDIWAEFENCFSRSGGLLKYIPVFEEYYRVAFKQVLTDNIQHLELRLGMRRLYDLQGNAYGIEEIIKRYQKMAQDIQKDFPEFSLKIIYSCHRHASREKIAAELRRALDLRRKYPDFVVGFDLMGEEDNGYDLIYFIDDFLEIAQEEEKLGIDLPYYFHAGESDWCTDKNLYDAVLLNSRRIGHGFNLFMHPSLCEVLKEKDISLEICPISNQMLRYVGDLRCHPEINYLNCGIQATLNPDDPGIMDYDSMAYDYYEAFMAWGLDIKSLKQFALNSIKYSALTEEEKKKALGIWQKRWHEFVLWLNERSDIESVKGKVLHEIGIH